MAGAKITSASARRGFLLFVDGRDASQSNSEIAYLTIESA